MFHLANKWKFLIKAPFKISDQCCTIMKKKPIKKFEKETGLKPFIGTMASDSLNRRSQYLQHGCISFKLGRATPLSFWFEKDIWEYIKKNKIPYSKIYDMGEHNTGCIFCMFGLHMEKDPNRFERMKIHHPQLYKYCMDKLGLKEVIDYIKRNTPKVCRKCKFEEPTKDVQQGLI